ncbi:MAG: hypothetical protein R3B92_00640 [Patescibacteria group bacterium]|uniref:Uncharacterized protein n=1 Tax=candidate division WWE3 bacterium TaxID=2053526 RepID=A0A955J3H3_UNCKA|nr:hypothetical protein [candidate division WWE3 bacterium]
MFRQTTVIVIVALVVLMAGRILIGVSNLATLGGEAKMYFRGDYLETKDKLSCHGVNLWYLCFGNLEEVNPKTTTTPAKK